MFHFLTAFSLCLSKEKSLLYLCWSLHEKILIWSVVEKQKASVDDAVRVNEKYYLINA